MRGKNKQKSNELVKDVQNVTLTERETLKARILIPLYNPYNISGRQGDIKDIPTDLVDELVRLKKIELI